MPPRTPARARRLKLLLALEITRVVRDLGERTEFLATVWSRYRTRNAFLDTVFSRWRTLEVTDMVLLDEATILAVEGFYDELESLRTYLTYTEDMPRTLEDMYALRLRRLRQRAAPAVEALGGEPARPHPTGPPVLLVHDPEA